MTQDGNVGKTELADAARIRYLTKENAEFAETPGHLLAVKTDGEEHSPVYVHCSFPHTNRRVYLSIRTADNKEIGMIRNLDDFPPETAALLERQMAIRYFTPEITKVVAVKEEFGYSYWEAETTAGLCRFTVRNGGGNVKFAAENRLLITDVDGNRFVIPRLDQLSEKEYRMVEMRL
ncbi:DUF1854 domain-containing protein [Paenibacillus cisolokensis]|uniref:DUF1854 domain-containing protein n=1 Tax=Paenibacillus cisolokensis TaxID=1658519 RepID=A0ABQ4NDV8_9BACL|nr:DUF1854 domain-containing protein [Paenibacillus cisolokensis]GIQ66417.1 hypothetical protein PACILC2_49850 [Paenibacillus cisolokensis]